MLIFLSNHGRSIVLRRRAYTITTIKIAEQSARSALTMK